MESESSSDEDIDIMLRTASDKLGWSSQKNTDDTLKMLLRNVEESKKKKKPYCSRVRRQTPTSRRLKDSVHRDARAIDTSKKTLSFTTCTANSSEEISKNTLNEADDECDVQSETLQDNLQVSANDGSDASQSDDHNFESITKNIETAGSELNLDNCPSSKYNPGFILPGTAPFQDMLLASKMDEVVENRVENSCVDTIVTESNFIKEIGAIAPSKLNPSWHQYRERDEHSDSEDDRGLKIDRDPEASSDEDEDEGGDTDLPTLSLSQRLLKNYHSKKAVEREHKGGENSDERCQFQENEGRSKKREKGGIKSVCSSNLSSSEDEDFETFLLKMKTPLKPKPKTRKDLDSDEDFINDDLFSDKEDNGPLLVYRPDNEECTVASVETPRSVLTDCSNNSTDYRAIVTISSSESSDTEDVFVSPVRQKRIDRKESRENFPSSLKTPVNKFIEKKKDTFLESLNTPPVGSPVHSPFVKDFKKKRIELTAKLFTMFNKTIFENKLPETMEILWNKRMRKTAGYCVYTKRKFSAVREVRIELSEKVCDTAERLRDTLVHEMCHAACWLIHGINDGHGRFWKYWANKANLTYPEIPVVKRCHSYEIRTKFKYQCQQCQAIIGRHSKSLDVSKKCCGLCRGKFVLLPTVNGKENTRRQPNKFAMFVKENYASIKKSNDRFKHGDVMRVLSQEFARKASVAN